MSPLLVVPNPHDPDVPVPPAEPDQPEVPQEPVVPAVPDEPSRPPEPSTPTDPDEPDRRPPPRGRWPAGSDPDASRRTRRLARDHVSIPRGSLASLSDGALMRRIAAADTEAFEALYDRHIVAAHAVAVRIVREQQRADDVCQEAFLAAWRSAESFDSRLGNARAWILSIALNRAIDHLRRTRRITERETGDDGLLELHAGPENLRTETTALRNVETTTMQRLLRELSEEQRRAIELCFYADCSHREVARRLDLPLGTVKARIRRGLSRLRTGLDGESEPRVTSPPW